MKDAFFEAQAKIRHQETTRLLGAILVAIIVFGAVICFCLLSVFLALGTLIDLLKAFK